jgi:two-component system nitrate/nitrite response regulator NarL
MQPKKKTIKVMIAEDQAIILQSLAGLVNSIDNIEVVGTALNGLELLKQLESEKPDIVLMDISMPKMNGMETTRIIDEKMPWVKVIVLSCHDHPVFIKKMFRSGAKGFLSKNATELELEKAINTVFEGGIHLSEDISRSAMMTFIATDASGEELPDPSALTSREMEIIQFLADGLLSKEIAEKLFISVKTVERHKTNILKKLQVRNTAQMVKVATDMGLMLN